MLPFKLVYGDGYYLPIGAHVFPATKYRQIVERLRKESIATDADFVAPEPVTDDDVRLAHTPEYVHKLRTGTLTEEEQTQLEIPYSLDLVNAFWLAAGGSVMAARLALRDGIAINVGGGFHHAFPNHGEGFCMINDIAVAIRRLKHDGKIVRAMTVDCDVHQGNGTAAIFNFTHTDAEPLPHFTVGPMPHGATPHIKMIPAEDFGEVFTISLHQQNNYPVWKPPSSIDVNLPDGVGDEEYLGWLDNALSSAFRQFTPELICYVAGADPYRYDQLGGLDLSIKGLKQRDEMVLREARKRGIPVFVTLAGGYAEYVADTVTIHCNTIVAAAEVFASVPQKN
jgi:acetoin utilization deacetylase AcuC-like enzyme